MPVRVRQIVHVAVSFEIRKPVISELQGQQRPDQGAAFSATICIPQQARYCRVNLLNVPIYILYAGGMRTTQDAIDFILYMEIIDDFIENTVRMIKKIVMASLHFTPQKAAKKRFDAFEEPEIRKQFGQQVVIVLSDGGFA